MLVASGAVGQVLVERAARGHVQHLHAAADAEQRNVTLEGAVSQGQLEAVALGPGAARRGVRPSPVRARIHVRPASQHEPVDQIQQLVRRLRDDVVRRQQDGQPTRPLYRQGIRA